MDGSDCCNNESCCILHDSLDTSTTMGYVDDHTGLVTVVTPDGGNYLVTNSGIYHDIYTVVDTIPDTMVFD